MKDFSLYFEIKDVSEDDEGNLLPATIKVTIARNITLEAYEEMLNKIKEVGKFETYSGICVMVDQNGKPLVMEERE